MSGSFLDDDDYTDNFPGRGSVVRELRHRRTGLCSNHGWSLEDIESRCRAIDDADICESSHGIQSEIVSLEIHGMCDAIAGDRTAAGDIRSRIASNNARTRSRGLDYCYSIKDWDRTVAVFGNRCVYCGKRTSSIEIEHFVPVCKGGGTSIGNIVPACRTCNQLKGVSSPEAYLHPDKYRDILTKLERLANETPVA